MASAPSLLFPAPRRRDDPAAAPECFTDLHLDQIAAAVTMGREEYNLTPIFWQPLEEADAITWRQEVMRDLEEASLKASAQRFAAGMGSAREALAQAEKLSSKLQRQRWHLQAVASYSEAAQRLSSDLAGHAGLGRGMTAFAAYLQTYTDSTGFAARAAEAMRLSSELAAIRYTITADGLRVRVRRAAGERDTSAEVEATFASFPRGEVGDRSFHFLEAPEVNAVEEEILKRVALLFPETFAGLETFASSYRKFQDAVVVAFDREVQFYLAYLEYVAPMQEAGLAFCYPQMTASKQIACEQGFDLALAAQLAAVDGRVVENDFRLSGEERTIVVTGPNQGGKTTFARMFGQMHYLARLGCAVPGARAQLFLCDHIFTHFEREEAIGAEGGKLYDDLRRAHDILARASGRSIILLNEIFSSTTAEDAVALSQRIAAAIAARDAVCVWVTFLDELAAPQPKIVSMASAVEPGNPAARTFKITRRPADGLAYAMALSEKHHLTYAAIRERLEP